MAAGGNTWQIISTEGPEGPEGPEGAVLGTDRQALPIEENPKGGITRERELVTREATGANPVALDRHRIRSMGTQSLKQIRKSLNPNQALDEAKVNNKFRSVK